MVHIVALAQSEGLKYEINVPKLSFVYCLRACHVLHSSQGRPLSHSDSCLSVSFYLKPPSSPWSGAQPGYTDPGCMSGREELVPVVAEDREERQGEEQTRGSWSWERDCLISAGASDGFDRAQAPIRPPD